MPNRSWLSQAKTLNDLGVTFYNSTAEKPWSEAREAHAQWKWTELMNRPVPVAERDLPYFGSNLHDSGVQSIERLGGDLEIEIDSVNARDFAAHLAGVLGIPMVQTNWPVFLRFYDVRYVRSAQVDRRGALRFLDGRALVESEFLYDWFFQQEGRLQWIANLWRYQKRFDYQAQSIYLMVDCARASAEDRCGEMFARLFGAPAAALYADAVQRIDDRPIDFNVYDSYQTSEYVLRRMKARGLTPLDFQISREPGHAPSAPS